MGNIRRGWWGKFRSERIVRRERVVPNGTPKGKREAYYQRDTHEWRPTQSPTGTRISRRRRRNQIARQSRRKNR